MEEIREDQSFKKDVKEFLSATATSQSRLAQMADVSTAALSTVLSGTYKGNTDEVIRKVRAVMERELSKTKQKIKKPDFVETSISEMMGKVIDNASLDMQIFVITGDAGIGKTMAVRNYVKENPSTILIETSPTYVVATVLEEIADELGLEIRGRKDRIEKAIIKKLKGSERMIIIDEAENLPIKALDILRRIYDKAEVPIVLVGMPKLLRTITAQSDKYKQIYSRMQNIRLSNLTESDTKGIVMTAITKASNDVLRAFHTVSGGNARVLSKLIIRSQRLSIVNNKDEIEVSLVKKAAETLLQA